MPSYLQTSMEIAREAGALLATYFEKRISYELKGEYDLVTEADRASERLVVDRLRAHFPSSPSVRSSPPPSCSTAPATNWT